MKNLKNHLSNNFLKYIIIMLLTITMYQNHSSQSKIDDKIERATLMLFETIHDEVNYAVEELK